MRTLLYRTSFEEFCRVSSTSLSTRSPCYCWIIAGAIHALRFLGPPTDPVTRPQPVPKAPFSGCRGSLRRFAPAPEASGSKTGKPSPNGIFLRASALSKENSVGSASRESAAFRGKALRSSHTRCPACRRSSNRPDDSLCRTERRAPSSAPSKRVQSPGHTPPLPAPDPFRRRRLRNYGHSPCRDEAARRRHLFVRPRRAPSENRTECPQPVSARLSG